MKILTYREPQNPEYREFIDHLKADAKRMFNYTVDDSLVSAVCVRVCVCAYKARRRHSGWRSVTTNPPVVLHGENQQTAIKCGEMSKDECVSVTRLE